MTAQPYQPATDRPVIDGDEADDNSPDEDEARSLHAPSPGYQPAHVTGGGAGQFGASLPPPRDPDLVVVPEDAVAGPDEVPDPEDVVTGTVVEVDADGGDGAEDYGAANTNAANTSAADNNSEDDLAGENDVTGATQAGDNVSTGYPVPGEPSVVAARQDSLQSARTSPAAMTSSPVAASPVAASTATASTATASPMAAGARPADLGQQWHDIQATFVDDPQGSVQRAAAAADAAVSALAEILRQRQAALTPASGGSADTEQLRETLRSYRTFCQNLADVGQQLRQPRP